MFWTEHVATPHTGWTPQNMSPAFYTSWCSALPSKLSGLESRLPQSMLSESPADGDVSKVHCPIRI